MMSQCSTAKAAKAAGRTAGSSAVGPAEAASIEAPGVSWAKRRAANGLSQSGYGSHASHASSPGREAPPKATVARFAWHLARAIYGFPSGFL